MRILAIAGFSILALSLASCGPGGAKKYDVNGTVTYDGKPIADGDITFYPENKSIGPEGGKIKDGKYASKAPEGKCKVEIRGSRVVPGKKGPMGEDWVESFIPDKYNDKSTLSAEVGVGKETHNFDLPK